MEIPSVTCYAQPGKAKSRLILEAFADGCGGRVVEGVELAPGPAVFYGVLGIENLWRAARDRGEYLYSDNSYFDAGRQKFFRVTKNALQATNATPDWLRFAALGLEVQPWQRDGRHIVVVEQSDYFMREVVFWDGGSSDWLHHVLINLKLRTDRPIVVRPWHRDKGAISRTLQDDLRNAWALVTHMSAAANEAVLAGVPVFVTGPCAALPMGLSELGRIENPRRPDGRSAWAAGLCAQQWTMEEMRDGTAWRALNAL